MAPVKLRSNLLLLVAGAILPVLALTVLLSFLLIEHETNAFRQAAMDRNRATAIGPCGRAGGCPRDQDHAHDGDRDAGDLEC